MAQDVLNLQEDSFERIINSLSLHSPAMKEHFDRAAKKIAALSGEWDDEDFQDLLEAMKNIGNKLEDIEDHTQQAIAKAEYKLEMIRARKSIKL